MREIINYTRLTTSDRLENKFVTCQAHIPQDRDKAALGTIFAQIEIESPWFSTSQVGQTIINTLIKEYYRGNDTSDLVNFEEAVKKVNEALAHIAQSGETEWIGKLSGVLILVNGSDIHFAQTGKSQAYLYRTDKINHITEGLESAEPPHPLKTFSNLTSGSLQEDDKIIVANNSFFDVINPTELRLTITSLPPSLAAIDCAKILQSHGCQDANAIFIELTNLDKLANLSPDQKLEAIYLDQQILTLGRLGKNALKNFSSSSKDSAKKLLGAFSKFSSEKVKPIAKKGLEKSQERSKQAMNAASKLVTNYKTAKEETHEEPDHSSSEKPSKIKLLDSRFNKHLTKMRNKIRRPLIKIGFYTKEKSKMYLALLLVVLLGLSGTVFYSLNSQHKKSKLKEAESAYQQIVSLSGEADVLSTSNNVNSAVEKYAAILGLNAKLADTKYQSQAQNLIDKANKKIAELAHLTEISAASSAELPGKSLVVYLNDNIYALAGSDLYNGKTSASSFVKTASLGFKADKIQAIEDLGLIAAISDKKLTTFNPSGNELKNSEAEFIQPQLLGVFGSNLYISDTGDNQLWKIPYAENSFGKKSSYFKDEVNIVEINSIGIDGSLYTLDAAGKVTRYSRGSKVADFQIMLPDNPKQTAFSNLIANDKAEAMLSAVKISDQWRILKIKKSGELIAQYRLKDVADIDSIAANQNLDKIFISSGNKALSFSLN